MQKQLCQKALKEWRDERKCEGSPLTAWRRCCGRISRSKLKWKMMQRRVCFFTMTAFKTLHFQPFPALRHPSEYVPFSTHSQPKVGMSHLDIKFCSSRENKWTLRWAVSVRRRLMSQSVQHQGWSLMIQRERCVVCVWVHGYYCDQTRTSEMYLQGSMHLMLPRLRFNYSQVQIWDIYIVCVCVCSSVIILQPPQWWS